MSLCIEHFLTCQQHKKKKNIVSLLNADNEKTKDFGKTFFSCFGIRILLSKFVKVPLHYPVM